MDSHLSGEQASASEQCSMVTLLACTLEVRTSNLGQYNGFLRFYSHITCELGHVALKQISNCCLSHPFQFVTYTYSKQDLRFSRR
jgi:hypothetical protein